MALSKSLYSLFSQIVPIGLPVSCSQFIRPSVQNCRVLRTMAAAWSPPSIKQYSSSTLAKRCGRRVTQVRRGFVSVIRWVCLVDILSSPRYAVEHCLNRFVVEEIAVHAILGRMLDYGVHVIQQRKCIAQVLFVVLTEGSVD